uniref:SRP54-type proteins GTP-binding domain-containing protein n=1 Tax=Chenopodium quinoa TaxID=63459 RepID=A0A803LA19_CHEQI
MESEATTMSMQVDDEADESNAARKRKRSRKSKVWREMTEGKNAKDDKVLSLTVDNASYNDVMVKHMKNRLGSRDKIRNLVKFVTRTSSRSKDFYDTAQKHFHLEAKRKLRMDMQSNVPLDDEWENLSVVHKFLKLFYDVTCMFSANKSPTSNMYFKGACMVHRRLLETSKGPHEFLAQIVLPMLEKFDKYWSEYNIYLACAAILDPRFKLKFVEYCFDKIYGLDEAMCKVEKVLNTLRSLYNEYKSTFSTSPIVVPSTTSSRIEDENFFDDYQSYSSRITRTQTKKSQLESYLKESELDLDMELDILEYWQQNAVRFSELAILARDLLTIPILLAAGDTFRAAASDQLEIWAERTDCEIVVEEKEKAKASSGKEDKFDIVLCDTSGRKRSASLKTSAVDLFFLGGFVISNFISVGLHTNYSLMEELIACKKDVGKIVSGAPNILTTIVVLAFLGFASAKNRVNVNRQNYVSKNTTQENIVPSTVQGTIFCVSYDGNDWTPMKGAYARVSCLRYLVESTMTNENGYYTISLPAKRYSDCKVFLDRPGDGNNCSVPTNTNQGLAGAPLVNPVRQPDNVNLYSYGPFVFNPVLPILESDI